jgi:protein farnesyltransferase subunit beta
MPHLATTYAAVNSLVTIGGETALASINRYEYSLHATSKFIYANKG